MEQHMMQKSYVIVQRKRIVQPDNGLLNARALGIGDDDLSGSLAADATITTSDLTPSEHEQLRRDPSTLAIAEAMPMKLIEPLQTTPSSPTSAATSSNTWGIEAVGAHLSPYDGSDITVAVLDTGIDPTHPAFNGVNLVRKNYTSETDDDLHGHGTHCAGTIFGRDVGGVRIGVARGVTKAIIGKVLGQGGGSSTQIVSAIQWAMDQGANVISMSLGIDFPGYVHQLIQSGLQVEPATSIALEGYRANINLFNNVFALVNAQNVFGKSGIIVAASGNESNRPSYEIAVAPPAAATGIVAVGAVAENGSKFEIADFSNTQPTIVAPGVDVVSAKRGGGLISMSGTSMATPHSAGVAALWGQSLYANFGGLNASLLRAKLIGSADITDFNKPVNASNIGAGLVKAP